MALGNLGLTDSKSLLLLPDSSMWEVMKQIATRITIKNEADGGTCWLFVFRAIALYRVSYEQSASSEALWRRCRKLNSSHGSLVGNMHETRLQLAQRWFDNVIDLKPIKPKSTEPHKLHALLSAFGPIFLGTTRCILEVCGAQHTHARAVSEPLTPHPPRSQA